MSSIIPVPVKDPSEFRVGVKYIQCTQCDWWYPEGHGCPEHNPWRECIKKPLTVQFREPNAGIEEIKTREGTVQAYNGHDYVIMGIMGEIYPIAKEIFENTYTVTADGDEQMGVDQFRQDERRMMQHAIEFAYDQLPNEDRGFSELPNALQHDFTWEELKALLSALEGVSPKNVPMFIFTPEEYKGIWYETILKVYALAMQHFSQLRVQPCRQEGCDGNIIFLKGQGVSPTTLVPHESLEKLGPNFTEDMWGYILAVCPSCNHIVMHEVP